MSTLPDIVNPNANRPARWPFVVSILIVVAGFVGAYLLDHKGHVKAAIGSAVIGLVVGFLALRLFRRSQT
jgi:uncharacterized protein YqgC (DUF456 family)